MIIKPQLTPGDAAIGPRASPDRLPIMRPLIGVKRVNTSGAPDSGIRLGDGKSVDTIPACGADGDDTGHVVPLAEIELRLRSTREVWEGQMAVRVDHVTPG